MSYYWRFHDLIQKDYDEAYEWYERQQQGLGDRFMKAVRFTIEQIFQQPEIFSCRGNRLFREAKINFFPYVIVYRVIKQSKTIFIVSIHHTKKNPRKKYRK